MKREVVEDFVILNEVKDPHLSMPTACHLLPNLSRISANCPLIS